MPSFRKLRKFLTYTSLLSPGRERMAPSFLIIGAQKAGTTSLFHYLSMHPLMGRPVHKEMHFFDNDERYAKGTGWYLRSFPFIHRMPRGAVAIEATPNYLFHPLCPERIYAYDPDMKMAIVLREPVSRAFSAWSMFHNFQYKRRRRRDADPRGFAEAVHEELRDIGAGRPSRSDYVSKGMYSMQIERYFALFPRASFHIIENRELKAEPRRVLDEACDFIGIPRHDWPASLLEAKQHITKYRSEMPEDIRGELADFFRPHNERLFELLGRRFDW